MLVTMMSCTQGCHERLDSRGGGRKVALGASWDCTGACPQPGDSKGKPVLQRPTLDAGDGQSQQTGVHICCLTACSFLSLIIFNFQSVLLNKKRSTGLATLSYSNY